MSYYDVITWGITGLGSVVSGGDDSLIFTAYDKDDSVVVAPSASYLVESPSESGNYILRVPDYTPSFGDYGIISDGVVGVGHQLTWMLLLPGTGGAGIDENISIEFEDTRIS